LSPALQSITRRLCIVSSPAGHHRTTLYCLRHCRASQDDSVLSPVLQDITGRLCIVSGTAGHHRTTLYCLSSCRTSQDDSVLSPALLQPDRLQCSGDLRQAVPVSDPVNWSTRSCKVRSENATFRLILISLYLEL
jgi:hypothetical protein